MPVDVDQVGIIEETFAIRINGHQLQISQSIRAVGGPDIGPTLSAQCVYAGDNSRTCISVYKDAAEDFGKSFGYSYQKNRSSLYITQTNGLFVIIFNAAYLSYEIPNPNRASGYFYPPPFLSPRITCKGSACKFETE